MGVAFIQKDVAELSPDKTEVSQRQFDLNTWEKAGFLGEKSIRVVVEKDKITVYKIYHDVFARVAAWFGHNGWEWARNYAEKHITMEVVREKKIQYALLKEDAEAVRLLFNSEVGSILQGSQTLQNSPNQSDNIDRIAAHILDHTSDAVGNRETLDKINMISQRGLVAQPSSPSPVKDLRAFPIRQAEALKDPKKFQVVKSSRRISTCAKITAFFVLSAAAIGLYAGLGIGRSQSHEVRAGGPAFSGASGTLPGLNFTAAGTNSSAKAAAKKEADDLSVQYHEPFELPVELNDPSKLLEIPSTKADLIKQKYIEFTNHMHEQYEPELGKFHDAFWAYQRKAETYLKAPNTATQKDSDFNQDLRARLDIRRKKYDEFMGIKFVSMAFHDYEDKAKAYLKKFPQTASSKDTLEYDQHLRNVYPNKRKDEYYRFMFDVHLGPNLKDPDAEDYWTDYRATLKKVEAGELPVKNPIPPRIPVELNDPSKLLEIPVTKALLMRQQFIDALAAYKSEIKEFQGAYNAYQKKAKAFLNTYITEREFSPRLRELLDKYDKFLLGELPEYENEFDKAMQKVEAGDLTVKLPTPPRIPVELNQAASLLKFPDMEKYGK